MKRLILMVLVGVSAAKGQNFTGKLYDQGGHVYNVMSYGAKGNNTQDDTQFIQYAASIANTGTVILPCGNYKVTSTISVSPNGWIIGASSGAGSGAGCATVTWAGTNNGPVFKTVGVSTSNNDSLYRGGGYKNFVIANGNPGVATALVGIWIENVGLTVDDMGMKWAGGYCVEMIATNSQWTERNIFGPGDTFNCGSSSAGTGDLGFVNSGGSGSFENTRILGSALDGHAIDVTTGSALYGSYISYHGNNGGGPSITATSSSSYGNTIDINIDCGGSSSAMAFIGAGGAKFGGHGRAQFNGCNGVSTASGFMVYPAEATLGAMMNAPGSNGPGNTVYIATPSRLDLGTENTALGMSDDTNGSYNTFMWDKDYTHPNTSCFTIKAGAPTVNASGNDAQMCADGTIKLGIEGVTFTATGAPSSCATGVQALQCSPWNLMLVGAMIYCSDCKNVAQDGATAGAACVAGGHGAFAKREGSATPQWDCN